MLKTAFAQCMLLSMCTNLCLGIVGRAVKRYSKDAKNKRSPLL